MTALADLNKYEVGTRITVRARLRIKTETGIGPDSLAGATVTAALMLADRSGLAAGTSRISATVISEADGIAEVTWSAAETGAIVPGVYLVSWRADFGLGPVSYEADRITVEAA